MKTLIANAIEAKRLIHLLYEGRSRTVEPHLLGKNDRNEDVFLGRQVAPWMPMEESWQIFRLTKVYGLLVLEVGFQSSLESGGLPAGVLAGIRLVA